jgi:diacylglycerol kinase (ATP)
MFPLLPFRDRGGETLRATVRAAMESPYKGQTGLRRVISATRNSFDGLAAALRHEDAFRQELVLAAVLVPVGLWLGRTGLERALLVASVLFVLVVELLNSAVEATVDRISFDNHRLAKRAKDIGSAAVMLALATAASVWLLVILQ